MAGKAEVWIDGRLAGQKTTFEAAPLVLTVPAGGGARQVTVIVERAPDQGGGMEGDVLIKAAPAG